MKDKLTNWTSGNGDPYRVPTRNYKYVDSSIRILDVEKEKQIRNIQSSKSISSFSLYFPVSYYLYKICAIDDLSILELLVGLELDREKGYIDYFLDFDKFPESLVPNTEVAMNIYADYPFGKMIEIQVKSYIKSTISRIDNMERVYEDISIGYILWQISKAYRVVYQKYVEEVGIYGHEFGDLAFGSITFYPDNMITVGIDS